MPTGQYVRHRVPLADRFWPKVICDLKTGCWLWTATRNEKGYGLIGSGGRGNTMLAHRAAWLIHHGKLPDDDALHTCDNPPCVRPDHLYDGTDAHNQRDVSERGRNQGRFPKGAAHPWPGGRRRVTALDT
jgi:hypothetical protein